MEDEKITCTNEQENLTTEAVPAEGAPAETPAPVDLSKLEPVINNRKKKENDKIGLIGFIISAVAIVMDIACLLGSTIAAGGLLVIFGICFSAAGLKIKKNHGFAVAGLVMGIISGLFLILLIVLKVVSR